MIVFLSNKQNYMYLRKKPNCAIHCSLVDATTMAVDDQNSIYLTSRWRFVPAADKQNLLCVISLRKSTEHDVRSKDEGNLFSHARVTILDSQNMVTTEMSGQCHGQNLIDDDDERL